MSVSLGAERVSHNQKLFDDATVDEMLLNDPLEDRRIACGVPRTFGIDDGDRAAFADAKTVRFRPEDAALLGETKLFQPALQKFPRGEATILLAAFRRRLIAAEKNVPPCDRHADALRD